MLYDATWICLLYICYKDTGCMVYKGMGFLILNFTLSCCCIVHVRLPPHLIGIGGTFEFCGYMQKILANKSIQN